MAKLDALTPGSAAIVATWVRSRSDAMLAGGPLFPFPLTGADLLAIDADPSWRVFTLADSAGRVVATASLFAKDEGRLLRVGRVIVDPARRGEGWGRRVMEELLALTDADPEVEATELGVFTHNRVARELYRKLGYVRSEGTVAVEVDGQAWHTEEFTRTSRSAESPPSR